MSYMFTLIWLHLYSYTYIVTLVWLHTYRVTLIWLHLYSYTYIVCTRARYQACCYAYIVAYRPMQNYYAELFCRTIMQNYYASMITFHSVSLIYVFMKAL